jgi:hypothetical protein
VQGTQWLNALQLLCAWLRGEDFTAFASQSLPPFASRFSRLGPLPARDSAGVTRFTVAPVHVQVLSLHDAIKNATLLGGIVYCVVAGRGLEPLTSGLFNSFLYKLVISMLMTNILDFSTFYAISIFH